MQHPAVPGNTQSGFSLVELSIVILVMGLLLGGIALPLSQQRDNARFSAAEQQLDDVQLAFEAYWLVNGSLPCPATPGSGGLSSPAAGGCTRQHGFVPATTLALPGNRNDDNLLLDPWGSPLRYSVSASDSNGNGSWDFLSVAEIGAVGIAALTPELVVCRSAAGASAAGCGSPGDTVASAVPLLIYSLGKDWAGFSSADQVENAGATVGGGPSGTSYRVPANAVFVARNQTAQAGNEYDDLLTWIPALKLYKGLLDAGHAP
ncbi:MAG: prepilin-type N-terminal cleavage/methylation domain-containing protein [Pseudomonadota bacterium]